MRNSAIQAYQDNLSSPHPRLVASTVNLISGTFTKYLKVYDAIRDVTLVVKKESFNHHEHEGRSSSIPHCPYLLSAPVAFSDPRLPGWSSKHERDQ